MHFDLPRTRALGLISSSAALILILLVAAGAKASTTLDIRGTYVGTSQANSSNYSIGAVIDKENCSTGAFSGYGYSNGQVYSTITGTLSGDINSNHSTSHEVYTQVTYSDDGDGYYSLDSQGRLASHGTFHDSNGVSGSADSTRVSGPPNDGGCSKRVSATQVSCDLIVVSNSFKCTAQVGDASGQGQPKVPTGSVGFNVKPNSDGSFPAGSSCSLAPSQTGGASAFCLLTFVSGIQTIPPGEQPPIVASYGGDTNFSSSSGSPKDEFAPPPDLGQPAISPTCGGTAATADIASIRHDGNQPAACALHTTEQQKADAQRELNYWRNAGYYNAGATIFEGACALGCAMVPDPTVTKYGAAYFGTLALGQQALSLHAAYMQNVWSDYLSKDPPANFHRLGAPPKVKSVGLKPPRGLSRADAARLSALLTALLKQAADARCIEQAIDRSGTAGRAGFVLAAAEQHQVGARCASSAAQLAARIPGLVARARPVMRKLEHLLSHRIGIRLLHSVTSHALKSWRNKRWRARITNRLVSQVGRYITLTPSDAASLRTQLSRANIRRGANAVFGFDKTLKQLAKQETKERRSDLAVEAEFANAAAGRG
jgi:hypothetical protein